jgi:hypothetical protein
MDAAITIPCRFQIGGISGELKTGGENVASSSASAGNF